MAEPIGIGMLGATHAHASGKMQVLRESEEWRVVGVCEPDDEARERLRGSDVYAGLDWMSQEKMLSHPGIQAIAVEGEVYENMDRAAAVVAARKHLHLDKPAGIGVADLEALVEAAEAQGLVVQLGYMFRYNPAFCFAFQAKEEGWLGEVHSIRGRMSTSLSAEKRKGLERYPGGMTFELGCHLLDAVVGLLGAPEDVNGVLRHDGPYDDALADNTVAVFQFAGAVATIEVTAMDVEPSPRRRFEVHGTGGSVVIEPLEPPALSACFADPPDGHPTGWHDVEVPEYRRYVDDFVELAACIREAKPLSYTGAHDIAVQKALMAACAG